MAVPISNNRILSTVVTKVARDNISSPISESQLNHWIKFVDNICIKISNLCLATIGASALVPKASGKLIDIRKNYAFVVMPMDPTNPELDDVLYAIKEGYYV